MSEERRYGVWAGRPKGRPENRYHCIKEIGRGCYGYQCTRKRGLGPDGLYCLQHAKMIEKK